MRFDLSSKIGARDLYLDLIDLSSLNCRRSTNFCTPTIKMEDLMKTLLLFASFFALNANAGVPFVGNFKTNVKTTTNLSCTDYTGKWEGICTYHTSSGAIEEKRSGVEIDMWSCNTALINRNIFSIGGMKVETTSTPTRSSTATIILEWNDKTRKDFITFSVNSRNLVFSSNDDNYLLASGTGSFKIQNNKLHLDQKLANGDTIMCEFFKQ